VPSSRAPRIDRAHGTGSLPGTRHWENALDLIDHDPRGNDGYSSIQSLPRRVRIFTRARSSQACVQYPSSLISCSQSGPFGRFFDEGGELRLYPNRKGRPLTFPTVTARLG
jgi:hypothetical protein